MLLHPPAILIVMKRATDNPTHVPVTHLHGTAGNLVTKSVPIVRVGSTVQEVEKLLLATTHLFDTINYVYVVSENQVLQGVVSVKEIFNAEAGTKIETLTHAPITVQAKQKQKQVALVALEHSIKAVPVVDGEHRLLGVVSSDQILHILHQEHLDDLHRLAGVRRHYKDHTPGIATAVRNRLPWLLLGLIGGLAAAVVVEQFSFVLASELVLAAFIPAVVYIADAVGAQAQLLFIQANSRRFTTSIFSYLWRELVVATWIGLALSILIMCMSYLWLDNTLVSIVLGASVFGTVYFSVIVAVVMPWSFHRYGFDPAVASGPLATVVRDISSLGIYLLIAALLLG